MEIRTQLNKFRNRVEILHRPEESASPPISFMSVSALTILNSALSAYTPPKGIIFNELTTYKLYPFITNIPGALTAVLFTVSVPGYLEGAFNRVTLAAGTEVPSASAAYFA